MEPVVPDPWVIEEIEKKKKQEREDNNRPRLYIEDEEHEPKEETPEYKTEVITICN